MKLDHGGIPRSKEYGGSGVIVEILIAFFSLEANAIYLRLMASTIIGFTTEKELMKQRER